MSSGKWTITVPNWQPATVNQLMNCHWSTRNRLKQVDKDMVAFYGREVPKATGMRRVRLTITLGYRQRGPDVDAFWKSVLDSLVSDGLLVDDRKEWVVLDPVQYKRGKERATCVELFDIDSV